MNIGHAKGALLDCADSPDWRAAGIGRALTRTVAPSSFFFLF